MFSIRNVQPVTKQEVGMLDTENNIRAEEATVMLEVKHEQALVAVKQKSHQVTIRLKPVLMAIAWKFTNLRPQDLEIRQASIHHAMLAFCTL